MSARRKRVVSVVIVPVAIVAIAVLLGMGMHSLRSDPPPREKVQPRPTVGVIHVAPETVTIQVHSQGTVTARRQIAWASEVSGRVTWVSPAFVEGNRVAADTPLLRIDDTDYRVAVAEAQAALADARLALEEERAELRRGTAYRGDAATVSSLRQPKLAQVEANFAAAQERLRQAQRDLAAAQINAPFDAVIDSKQVDLGQYVSTGSPLFNLLSTDVAEVRLPVTAADIGFLRRDIDGELPTVTLQSVFGGARQQWQGQLVRIEQRVDAETRTFYAVAAVEQPYDTERYRVPLVIGSFVDADIEGVTISDGMRLPRSALHDNRYVFLVRDQRLQRRDIEVYRREPSSVLVREGLQDGDQVVVTPLDLMVEGMAVTPVVQTTPRGEVATTTESDTSAVVDTP